MPHIPDHLTHDPELSPPTPRATRPGPTSPPRPSSSPRAPSAPSSTATCAPSRPPCPSCPSPRPDARLPAHARAGRLAPAVGLARRPRGLRLAPLPARRAPGHRARRRGPRGPAPGHPGRPDPTRRGRGRAGLRTVRRRAGAPAVQADQASGAPGAARRARSQPRCRDRPGTGYLGLDGPRPRRRRPPVSPRCRSPAPSHPTRPRRPHRRCPTPSTRSGRPGGRRGIRQDVERGGAIGRSVGTRRPARARRAPAPGTGRPDPPGPGGGHRAGDREPGHRRPREHSARRRPGLIVLRVIARRGRLSSARRLRRVAPAARTCPGRLEAEGGPHTSPLRPAITSPNQLGRPATLSAAS